MLQGSAEDAPGSSAALSRHSASIPADESWANPSELWGSYWVFTYFFNSARTSVYIPLLMFSREQKCIPNFLHSNFACSILMRVVTLHGLLPYTGSSPGLLCPLGFTTFTPSIMILSHLSFISSTAHQDVAVSWLQSIPDAYKVLAHLQSPH